MGSIIAVVINEKYGPIFQHTLSFGLVTIAGTLIYLFGDAHPQKMPLMIFLALFALGGNFYCSFFTVSKIFPTEHVANVSGLCYFTSMAVGVIGPIIAE